MEENKIEWPYEMRDCDKKIIVLNNSPHIPEKMIILPATGEEVKDKEEFKNEVVIIDEGLLRRESRVTTREEVEERKIVLRMKAALKTSWINGYGLAAIQINMPVRMAWYQLPDKEEVVLINCEIVAKSGFFTYGGEGCLSIPNVTYNTTRYQHVSIKGIIIKDGKELTEYEASGIEAVVIQHELDHWDGVLCKDMVYDKKKIPGRNEPCDCSSGKKAKKCCYR